MALLASNAAIREVHRQLNHVLAAQTLVPILTNAVTWLLGILRASGSVPVSRTIEMLMSFLSMGQPVFNALLLLLLIRPYRVWIARELFGRRGKTEDGSQVVHVAALTLTHVPSHARIGSQLGR